MDRRARFQRALQVALDTDTQGYTTSTKQYERSAQELTALSWAAFESDLLPELDTMYRVQALDADDLLERLKLALHMLREKKTQLRKRMQKAGLKFRNAEDETDGESRDTK